MPSAFASLGLGPAPGKAGGSLPQSLVTRARRRPRRRLLSRRRRPSFSPSPPGGGISPPTVGHSVPYAPLSVPFESPSPPSESLRLSVARRGAPPRDRDLRLGVAGPVTPAQPAGPAPGGADSEPRRLRRRGGPRPDVPVIRVMSRHESSSAEGGRLPARPAPAGRGGLTTRD